MATATPFQLAHSQAQSLSAMVPRVMDGDVDAIHDARVSTRRIHELLPLMYGSRHSRKIGHLTTQFRRIGRALGRVRDEDVRVALLGYLQARLSHGVPSLDGARLEAEKERARHMRKLIKRFERLEVAKFLRHFADDTLRHRLPFEGLGWRSRLRTTLSQRAVEASEAMERAGGVYFPQRMHSARMALKRLRYATEIDEVTGGDRLDGAVKALRKSQDVLGKLHDRQVLLDALPADLHEQAGEDQIRLIVQLLEAEARDLHARYLERRPRLLEVCAGVRRVSYESRHGIVAPAIAVGAVALAAAAGLHSLRGPGLKEPAGVNVA